MWKRMVLLGGILVAVLLVLGAAGYFALKPARLTEALEREVLARTGSRLAYTGSPRVTLWPAVTVSLDQPLLPAPGGSGPPLLKARTLRLETGFSALMSGEAAGIALVLEEARLNLTIDQAGKANWQLPPGSAAAPAGLPLSMKIAKGTIAYLDERAGVALTASDIDAAVVPLANGEGVAFKGSLVLDQRFSRFDGELKSLARLASEGSPLSLRLDGPGLTAGFDGRLSAVRGLNLAGQLSASSKDLGGLASWFGLAALAGPLPQEVSLAGAIDAGPETVALKRTTLTLGGALATGDLAISRSKGRLALTGLLSADAFDLAPFAAALFPARTGPVDFTALGGFDASFRVEAKTISFAARPLAAGRVEINLAAGALDVKAPDLALFGGKAAVQLVLDGSQPIPAVLLAVNGRDLDGAALSAELGSGVLAGKLSAALSVAGSGKTGEDLLATLKGAGELGLKDGQLNGFDLATLIRRAGGEILEGVTLVPGAATPVTAAGMTFKFADGIGFSDAIALKGPGLTLDGKGEVDFPRGAADLSFAATLGGKPLPAALLVKGPLTALRIYPDVTGILDRSAEAFADLKKRGWPERATP